MLKKLFFIPILVAAIVAGWQLFMPGYYPMHDDLQVMRLYQMDRCFKDGQVPCRLAPDMGYGYGQPMFNFYSVFPYYLGELIHFSGLSYVDTVKALFFLSLFVSGVFVFLLSRQFFNPLASYASAFAYMFAPYHALDIFVRGAMSESWGLALVPAVIYFLYRLSRQQNYSNMLGFGIAVFAFLTSHHLTTIINLPLFVTLFIYLLVTSSHPKKFIISTIIASAIGVGLASFFILPVIFEKSLIQQQSLTSDYYTYTSHYATINQLFISNHWGYGPSKFGADDDISFAFGYLQTLALLISPVIVFIYYRQKRYSHFWLTLIASLFCLLSLFMTHNKSTFIWQAIPILAYIQFPWRYLGMSIFTSSIIIGASINLIKNKYRIIGVAVCLALLFINFSYFRFEKYFYWIDDQQKLSGELFALQSRAAISDYLPLAVKRIPILAAPNKPEVSGRSNINYYEYRSNYFSTEIDIYDDDGATVTFPVVFYPGWTLYLNRQPQPVNFTYDNDLGLITITLPKGHQLIQGWFEDTPTRRIANLITLGTLGIVLVIYLKRNQKS